MKSESGFSLAMASQPLHFFILRVSFSAVVDFLTLKGHLKFERFFHKLSRLSPPHQVVHK